MTRRTSRTRTLLFRSTALVASLALTSTASLIASTSATAAPNPYTAQSSFPVTAGLMAGAVDESTGILYASTASYGKLVAIDPDHQSVRATIDLGTSTYGVAVDDRTGLVFVSNFDLGALSIVSTADDTLVGRLPTGVGPAGVAVDRSAGRVYVANSNSDSVTVVDEYAGTVVHTIAVGDYPTEIAVDATTGVVLVANQGSGTVSVIDPASWKVTRTLTFSAPVDGVAVDQATGHVFVSAHTNGASTASIFAVDPTTFAISTLATVPGFAQRLTMDPATGILTAFGGATTFIDVRTGAMEAPPAGNGGDGAAVDSVTNRVFLLDNLTGTVTVILEPVSITSAAPASPLVLGAPATFGFTARGAAPVTFSVSYGALPDGLTLGSDGRLSGTPTQLGSYDFSVMATDGDGYTAAQSYEQTVNPTVDRVAGPDRYATSVAVSQKAYPGTAPVVFVASGAAFPDALSAGPAAVAAGGPLLLTSPGVLPQVVSDEIARLQPAKIVVVGGPAAISEDVVTQLGSLVAPGGTVVRTYGADRYSTSQALVASNFSTATTVYVATGANFPDALAAGAAAGSARVPLLLVDGSSLDDGTRSALRSLRPSTILIAGGTNTITASLASALAAFGTVKRLSGADRYATAAAINSYAHPAATSAFVAQSLNFPDALSASAWAGRADAPLYLAPSNCMPSNELTALQTLNVPRLTLVGGTAVLSPAVETLTSC
jgi:YVTN family beta-propeller protein